MRRKGRPKKDESKSATKRICLRLTEEESEKLEDLSERLDIPKTTILKRGIYVYAKEELQRNKRNDDSAGQEN